MRIRNVALALAATIALATSAPVAALAGGDPLFANVTTSEPHRANMAIGFTRKQQERKHPVTVFLNDKAVMLAAKSKAGEFAEQQAALTAIIKDGGQVVVCPMCMKHYGVTSEDLIEGAVVSNPDLIGKLLFDNDDTKTLSW